MMVNMTVSEKINKFFYKSPEGKILKYSQYYIEKNVKHYHLIIMKN